MFQGLEAAPIVGGFLFGAGPFLGYSEFQFISKDWKGAG
jgi:hypothetical protein